MEFGGVCFLYGMRNKQLSHTLFRLIVLAAFDMFGGVILYYAIPGHMHQRVLKFNLISDKPEHPYGRIFFVELLNGKVVTKFNLSGNPEVDDKILDEVDLETRRLNTTNDNLQCIKSTLYPKKYLRPVCKIG